MDMYPARDFIWISMSSMVLQPANRNTNKSTSLPYATTFCCFSSISDKPKIIALSSSFNFVTPSLLQDELLAPFSVMKYSTSWVLKCCRVTFLSSLVIYFFVQIVPRISFMHPFVISISDSMLFWFTFTFLLAWLLRHRFETIVRIPLQSSSNCFCSSQLLVNTLIKFYC